MQQIDPELGFVDAPAGDEGKAGPAAVRIAMTVAEAGLRDGKLYEVVGEAALDSDAPLVTFAETQGRINADLSVGPDVTKARPLLANAGLASPGVKLHGKGFIVSPKEAAALGLGEVAGLDAHIRPYRNGRDLLARSRDAMVIDLFGVDKDAARRRFGRVHEHLLKTVKPERDGNNRATYRDNWWVFGEPRAELRPALAGLPRYIATVETAKHRLFHFLDASILPDNMLVAIASDDPFHLGVLSSRIHVVWAVRAGGWLGVGNDPRYSKSLIFDPFPFPIATEPQRARIAALAQDMLATRADVLRELAKLDMTELYNRVAMAEGAFPVPPVANPPALDPATERLVTAARARTLADLHRDLDAAVAAAYGWDATLTPAEIVAKLVELNAERAGEERDGVVRWLRPAYQIGRERPRGARGGKTATT